MNDVWAILFDAAAGGLATYLLALAAFPTPTDFTWELRLLELPLTLVSAGALTGLAFDLLGRSGRFPSADPRRQDGRAPPPTAPSAHHPSAGE